MKNLGMKLALIAGVHWVFFIGFVVYTVEKKLFLIYMLILVCGLMAVASMYFQKGVFIKKGI